MPEPKPSMYTHVCKKRTIQLHCSIMASIWSELPQTTLIFKSKANCFSRKITVKKIKSLRLNSHQSKLSYAKRLQHLLIQRSPNFYQNPTKLKRLSLGIVTIKSTSSPLKLQSQNLKNYFQLKFQSKKSAN